MGPSNVKRLRLRLSAAHIILIFHCLSALSVLLPYILDIDLKINYEESMVDIVHSRIHIYSTICAVAVTIPMTFDGVLGGLSGLDRYWAPRSVMVLALLLPNALILYSERLSSSDAMKLFVCAFEMRTTLLVGGGLSYSTASSNSRPIRVVTYCSSVLFVAQSNIYVWEPFVSAPGDDSGYSILSLVSTILSLIAISTLVILHTRDVIPILKTNFALTRRTVLVADVDILGANVLLKIIVYFCYQNSSWENVDATELALFNLLDSVAIIMAFTLTGRVLHKELVVTQTLLETKKNFVKCISHEVRTPLNTVRMGLQLLLSRAAEFQIPEECALILSDINASCENSIDVLNELLLYDKMEDNSVLIEKESTLIRDILLDTISPFVVQADQVGVRLKCEGISEQLNGVLVEVDRNKFAIVLRNLISNSIKFSQTQREIYISAWIEDRVIEAPQSYRSASSNAWSSNLSASSFQYTRTKRENSIVHPVDSPMEESAQIVRIEVKDFGPGISKENQKKLFQEIIQFNPAKLQQGNGSGIGLWLSKAIIDRHGGAMGVTSSGIPGEGSVFHVELAVSGKSDSSTAVSTIPASDREDNSPSDQQHSEEKPLVTESNSSSSVDFARALVVDDSSLNRRMVRRIISYDVKHIDEACDGTEAVTAYIDSLHRGQQDYNVIFMDSIMPNMNGSEAVRELRKLGFTGYIAGVTGNAHSDDITDFLNSGVDSVHRKPLGLSDVKSILNGTKMKMQTVARHEISPGIKSKSVNSSVYHLDL